MGCSLASSPVSISRRATALVMHRASLTMRRIGGLSLLSPVASAATHRPPPPHAIPRVRGAPSSELLRPKICPPPDHKPVDVRWSRMYWHCTGLSPLVMADYTTSGVTVPQLWVIRTVRNRSVADLLPRGGAAVVVSVSVAGGAAQDRCGQGQEEGQLGDVFDRLTRHCGVADRRAQGVDRDAQQPGDRRMSGRTVSRSVAHIGYWQPTVATPRWCNDDCASRYR